MTVSEYFHDVEELAQRDLEELIGQITDRTLDMDTSHCKKFPYWEELAECCLLAVRENAGLEFSGRWTCALIMGSAMRLLKERHGRTVPAPWYAVIKTLRATPGDPVYRKREARVQLVASDEHTRRYNTVLSLWNSATKRSVFEPPPDHVWAWIEKNAAGPLTDGEARALVSGRPDCPEELKAILRA